MEHMGEHFPRDVMVELLDLLPNVAEECVAGPAADHHDEENGTTPEEHGHGCTRADGVCSDLVRRNVECVLPDCRDGILQRVRDLFGRDVFDAVVLPDGGDWSIIVGSWVRSDPTDNGCCGTDWAQGDVARGHLGGCVVLLVFLLHFKCDVEAVGELEAGIVVRD